MPTTVPVRPKGVRLPSNVVSIRDHLLGRSEVMAAGCVRTRRILALTTPDETGPMNRDIQETLAD